MQHHSSRCDDFIIPASVPISQIETTFANSLVITKFHIFLGYVVYANIVFF